MTTMMTTSTAVITVITTITVVITVITVITTMTMTTTDATPGPPAAEPLGDRRVRLSRAASEPSATPGVIRRLRVAGGHGSS
jgi:hypothetical protein